MTSSLSSSLLVCVDCAFVVMAFSVVWLRTRRRPGRPCGGRALRGAIATAGPDANDVTTRNCFAHGGRRRGDAPHPCVRRRERRGVRGRYERGRGSPRGA